MIISKRSLTFCIRIYLFLSFCLIHVINVNAATRVVIVPAELSDLSSGEYLSNNYIKLLNSTLSPIKSEISSDINLLLVNVHDDVADITVIYNFHEGGEEFRLTKDGSVFRLNNPGVKIDNVSLKIVSKHSISLGFNKYKKTDFTFIGKVEDYLLNKVLHGVYSDKSGAQYIFDNHDGMAHFPNKSFSYSIGVDHIFQKFDYFVDNYTGDIYGFMFDGNELYIYETSGEMREVRESTPCLILTRR